MCEPPWSALVREAGASAFEFARWTVRRHQSAGAYRRALARHERLVRQWRALFLGGFTMGAAGAGLSLLESGEVPLALMSALAGCGLSLFARMRGVQLSPPDPADYPAITVTFDSSGGRALRRLDNASRRMRQMCQAVSAVDRSTGADLERATGLAERSLRLTAQHLGVLEGMVADPVARASLIAQLDDGVTAYEKTLAAAAELLAAPSLAAPITAMLCDAQDALAARTYGQTVAAERLRWPE